MASSKVLLLAKNPLGEDLGFFFGDRVWRHRDRTPYALAAVLDVAGQQIGSAVLPCVLGGDFLERRAYQLGIDAVASRARLALEQRLTILRQCRLQGQRAAQGEHRDKDFLH